jgi:RND superfamily putative drug exporter
MSINGIFAAVFGLSISYQVLLLTRIREQVAAGDGSRTAIRHALRATAAPVTGAAAVTVAAVVPFLATDLLTVRQFGIAVATAVLLDALIVRPVVLPATLALLPASRPVAAAPGLTTP